ncbi:MAG TPA: hypothetical protein G4O08_08120 [Anaerolineae bacterium]|nr:hypothetical protein [Anaerolineae bacterium]
MDMELEAYLRPPEMDMPPYPAKVITLATGGKLVVRQVNRDAVPRLLQAVRPTLEVPRDYYDIVGVRLYAELLGWYRYRVRDEFCLIGQIDGLLVGIVNTRAYSPEVDISLHTLAIERGLRIGAHLFAAKMEYSIEYCGREEVLITAESPIGFRRWMIEYDLEKREGQHELGGATPYALTRDLYYRNKERLVAGERPVPEELMQVAEREIIIASEEDILEKILGAKRRIVQ